MNNLSLDLPGDRSAENHAASDLASTTPHPENLRVHYLPGTSVSDLALIRQGIAADQPWLHPKFFYDTAGSELFDAITRSPEYYPTRTEAHIFEAHAQEMLSHVPTRKVLVEPGSGNCDKAARLLSDPELAVYVPIEISADFLVECCSDLAKMQPGLAFEAICGDFTQCTTLPESVPSGGRILFFPGSTIGNFDPDSARALLQNFHGLAGAGGHLLIGTDLPKERHILEAAYNDAEGLTARFNLNILTHLNHRFDCHFATEDFQHRAFYNSTLGRIEMHLVSLRDTEVWVENEVFTLAKGRSIHTESSYKYTTDGFTALARETGFEPVSRWTDARQWFAVHLFKAI